MPSENKVYIIIVSIAVIIITIILSIHIIITIIGCINLHAVIYFNLEECQDIDI